jgi:hypothetical protein
MEPSSPPTSATSSDATVRPCDLEDVRGILDHTRDRGDGLLDNQPSTNRKLDNLRDNTELNDRLQRLEDQQRELMRYMKGLNEWLERDVYDRQAELRGVFARVDRLRDDMGRLVCQPQG